MGRISGISIVLTCIIIASFIWSGCATIIKGYDDEVLLLNSPDSLRVFTKDGAELSVVKSVYRVKDEPNGKYTDKVFHSILLRSSQSYTLVLKSGQREKRVEAHPHISTGWFILDLITLSFFVDIYTGSWNYFRPIDASF